LKEEEAGEMEARRQVELRNIANAHQGFAQGLRQTLTRKRWVAKEINAKQSKNKQPASLGTFDFIQT
jgi:hypothetical protein